MFVWTRLRVLGRSKHLHRKVLLLLFGSFSILDCALLACEGFNRPFRAFNGKSQD